MSQIERNETCQDKSLECCDCGAKFTWESGEQLYYRDRSLSPPRRCLNCRAKRRQTLHPPTEFDTALKNARALFPNGDEGVRQ